MAADVTCDDAVGFDPFGLPINPADLDDVTDIWPPADRAELARLDAWANEMEWEHAQRYGHNYDGE